MVLSNIWTFYVADTVVGTGWRIWLEKKSPAGFSFIKVDKSP